jgi:anti-anti-sigma factor
MPIGPPSGFECPSGDFRKLDQPAEVISIRAMLNLTEQDLGPGRREIRVSGELDLAVAGELDEALGRAIGVEQVCISLDGCEFIDSTGIAVIVRAYSKSKERGDRIGVVGCSGQVQRVLKMTGLTENGLVFDDLDAALAAWS